jgi:hypothetical protein
MQGSVEPNPGDRAWPPCSTHSVESYVSTNASLDILGKREISNPYLESNDGLFSPSSELYTAVCCVDEHYVPSPAVTLCTARCNSHSALKY